MQLATVTLYRIASCETCENVVGPGLCRLGWGCGCRGFRLWVGLWVQVVGGVVGVMGVAHPAGVPAPAVRQHVQEDEDGVESQW